ncbi:hypothetical protein GMRT_12495 [Giardia muris]|uniref:Uncharacterized protein n=1 Tax=Giardia muris TaxID=5742 RepID=A0A4Z1T1W6_GIAMU|nr:hypothetical protein GMRT_12495 [Giardia muris]|eukprot:TNJ27933.1 hypothetical protein GMRT_12495 [Giardia muris]
MDLSHVLNIQDFDLDEVEESIRKCEEFLAREEFTLDSFPTADLSPMPAQQLSSPSHTAITKSDPPPDPPRQRGTPVVKHVPADPPTTSKNATKTRSRPTTSLQSKPPPNPTPRPASAPMSSEPPSQKQRPATSITGARGEAYRREKEEREMAECTFKPRINKSYRVSTSSEAPEIRLQQEGERRRKELEKLRINKERAEIEECTFQPRISARSAQLASKRCIRPMYDRVREAEREKRRRLQEVATLVEAATQPTLDPRSRARRDSLAQKSLLRSGLDPRASPAERLYSPGPRRPAVRATVDGGEAIECSFAPRINPESTAIASRNTSLNTSFIERQKYYAEKKTRHLQELERSTVENLTFHPQVRSNSAGRRASSAAPSSPSEGGAPKAAYERLYEQQIVKNRHLRNLQQEAEDTECTFVPEINDHSRAIGRRSTLGELYANSSVRHKRELLTRALEEERYRECTFKPQVCPGSARGHYNMKNPAELIAQIELERKEKTLKLNMLRKKLEYNEVQTCSFKPEVNPTVPPTIYNGPSVPPEAGKAAGSEIRGLEKFMEKQELIRRRKDEQRQREEKVFGYGTSSTPRPPYTVPEPFNLSHSSVSTPRQERTPVRPSVDSECTFRPRTSERRVKDLVAHILNNDE